MDYPICMTSIQKTEETKEEKDLRHARLIIGKSTTPKKVKNSSSIEEKLKWGFMHGKDKTRQ